MTKPALYKYILLFSLFASTDLFGQNNISNSEDAYQPDSLFAVRNALKIDPLQFIFGDYSLDYERILKGPYSLELGLGFTRRNYAAGWFDYSLDNLGKNVKIKTGYAISLSARRYFKNTDELYGAYLAANFAVRTYTTDYNVIDSTGVLTDFSFRDSRIITSYAIIFGYQALPARSNVFADFYLGIALRNKDFSIVKSEEINNAPSYFIDDKNAYVFGLEVGVKLGFGF